MGMSLTPSDLKKMDKIQKDMEDKKRELEEKSKELEAIKLKASEEVAKISYKFNLWKLDKKTLETAFEKIAKEHKI